MDIMDLSDRTHCRSEVNEVRGGEFSRFRRLEVFGERADDLELGWDKALDHARRHMGERDHAIRNRKRHLHDAAVDFGIAALIRRAGVRRILGRAVSDLRQGEWVVPRWLGCRGALDHTFLVLKIVLAPRLVGWVLRRRSQDLVVHTVRHPGGYLSSWGRRYLARHDPQDVSQANIARLCRIRESDPAWGEAFGDIERMSVDESELWYWRYANETVQVAGTGAPNYFPMTFEGLAAEPLRVAGDLYRRCGLEWSRRVRHAVEASARRSEKIARAWHEDVTSEQRTLVERILDGSPLAERWRE